MKLDKRKSVTGQKLRWLFHLLAIAVMLTLIPAAAHAGGGHKKLADDLSTFPVNADGTVSVIIQFNQTPEARHFEMMAARGGRLKFSLEHINGAAYRIPVKMLKWLENHPDVAYVSPDRPNKVASDTDVAAVMDDVARQQYGLGRRSSEKTRS